MAWRQVDHVWARLHGVYKLWNRQVCGFLMMCVNHMEGSGASPKGSGVEWSGGGPSWLALMTAGATTEKCFFSASALTSALINSHRKLLRAKICPARSMAAEKVPQIRKQSAADYQHHVKSDFVYSNGHLCAPEPSPPRETYCFCCCKC